MNDPYQNKDTNADEIDLTDLLVKVALFFKKNRVTFITFFFGGILLGVVYYWLSPRAYESKMVVQSDILTEVYGKGIIESLENTIIDRNYKILAERLGLSLDEARDITRIEFEGMKQEGQTKDMDKTIFVITVQVESPELLPKLQQGILTYFRTNDFVKVRVKQREATYARLIDKIQKEINSLDSLKSQILRKKTVSSGGMETMLVDPANIYSTIIQLNKEQLNYKNALELVDSIQLVEGFTVFEKPASPKLSMALLIGFAGGFLMALLFLGGRWLDNTIKN